MSETGSSTVTFEWEQLQVSSGENHDGESLPKRPRGRPKKENTTNSELETATEASETSERRSSRTVKPTTRRLQADEDDSLKKAQKERAATGTKNPVGRPRKQAASSKPSISQEVVNDGIKKTVQGKNPVGRPRKSVQSFVPNVNKEEPKRRGRPKKRKYDGTVLPDDMEKVWDEEVAEEFEADNDVEDTDETDTEVDEQESDGDSETDTAESSEVPESRSRRTVKLTVRRQEAESYASWKKQQKERSMIKKPVGRPRKQTTQSSSTQNLTKLTSPFKQKTVPAKNPVGRPPKTRKDSQSVKTSGQNNKKEEAKPRGRPRKWARAETEQQDDVEAEYEFENEDTTVNVTNDKLDKKDVEPTHKNGKDAEQRETEVEGQQKEEKENESRRGCTDKPDTRLLFTPEVFPDLAEREKNPESKSIHILPLPRPFSRDQTPFSEIYDELIDDIRKGRNCFPNAPHKPLFDFCLFCKSYRCTKDHYWYAYAINNRVIKSGKFDKDPITKESVLKLLCAFRDEHLLADSTERPVELDYRLEDYTIWHDVYKPYS
ncbi:hypothetical protein B9Z55_022416 [Caenorhabditis nigoni]|uniref:Uncharacterized protein n=1 Tax=Caenorhabditis nigoni TaxID=1611254 RepID=A0A2G5SKK4_9PELO|nr:hypothetical protein B9Z55_022416 [Caenorhabditis nigoni]